MSVRNEKPQKRPHACLCTNTWWQMEAMEGVRKLIWKHGLLMQGGLSRGLTNADVVNDGAKLARVRIDGIVNGKPFTVERSTRRRAPVLAAI